MYGTSATRSAAPRNTCSSDAALTLLRADCSFSWHLNATTGVPTTLINTFSPHYDNTSLPDSLRKRGSMQARARVYYVENSMSDGKPAWRFDHGGAGEAHNLATTSRLAVLTVACCQCRV
jgi:hypothetical protein